MGSGTERLNCTIEPDPPASSSARSPNLHIRIRLQPRPAQLQFRPVPARSAPPPRSGCLASHCSGPASSSARLAVSASAPDTGASLRSGRPSSMASVWRAVTSSRSKAGQFGPGLLQRNLRAQLLLVRRRPGLHPLARRGGRRLRHRHQLAGHLHQPLRREHLDRTPSSRPAPVPPAADSYSASDHAHPEPPDLPVELLLAGKRDTSAPRPPASWNRRSRRRPSANPPRSASVPDWTTAWPGRRGRRRHYLAARRAELRIACQRQPDGPLQREGVGARSGPRFLALCRQRAHAAQRHCQEQWPSIISRSLHKQTIQVEPLQTQRS